MKIYFAFIQFLCVKLLLISYICNFIQSLALQRKKTEKIVEEPIPQPPPQPSPNNQASKNDSKQVYSFLFLVCHIWLPIYFFHFIFEWITLSSGIDFGTTLSLSPSSITLDEFEPTTFRFVIWIWDLFASASESSRLSVILA